MKNALPLCAVVAAFCCLGKMHLFGAGEVPGRTWDRLENVRFDGTVPGARELSRAEIAKAAKGLVPLCMIGDSITWSSMGDWWRRWLVEAMPELTFIGTHTACLGYGHAGEGADSTYGVMKRAENPLRVPDCPYYHLLIGINDCSAAKCNGDVWRVASNTVSSIEKIVDRLLSRPCTKKIFLGSILPGALRGPVFFRDSAGSASNVLLRERLAERFPAGRVVWVEYEKPLRAQLEVWKKPDYLADGLHPARKGYKALSDILVPVLKKETEPQPVPGGRHGVAVENLWNDAASQTSPLIPGWYILSFDPEFAGADKLKVRLFTEASDPKKVFDRTFEISPGSAGRCSFEFMTGYERYGYTEKPFRIKTAGGCIRRVQIEKMRPSRKASRYGAGTFIDTDSPICAGEPLAGMLQ